jgi:hypothetical protein
MQLRQPQNLAFLEVSNILATVIDVPVNRFLGDDIKPKPLVFHIRRQFHGAQSIGLPDLVQLDSVASTTTFSRRSRPSM